MKDKERYNICKKCNTPMIQSTYRCIGKDGREALGRMLICMVCGNRKDGGVNRMNIR